MAFLKKSTSKLKGLSLRATNAAAIDEARAESKPSQPIKKNLSAGMLETAWKKLEETNSPTATLSIKDQASPLNTDKNNEADRDNVKFVANELQSFKAPDFQINNNTPNDHIDVTKIENTEADNTKSHNHRISHPQASQLTEDFDMGVEAIVPRPARADMSAMRLDVARISADIQSGEELYRRAQQRIENLTSFVEHADIDFSLLNRLEPENRRLKARNRTIELELDDKQRKLSILQIDLDDHRKRLEERNAVFEQAQSKLSVAKKSIQTYERTLHTVQQKLNKSDLSQERIQTALDVERRENEILRERVETLSADINEKQNHYLEAKKMADSLVQDCNDFRQSADTVNKTNTDLRNALDAAQKQNNAMKGEMIGLHEDIRNFKTQYEFNVISREDEITALQNQVTTLKKQLEIKDEIVRNAARDVTELRKIRTAQDIERERLETQIQTQNFQLEEINSELSQTQQDVSDFDRRYRDVATALSATQARRANNEPAVSPDIQPLDESLSTPVLGAMSDVPTPMSLLMPNNDEFPANLEEKPSEYSARDSEDLYEDLSDDDIINRITEFKLGLRKEIG
ncbi:MAG: hypothetical protein ABJG88_06940 [Litorimonas sp.]